MYLVIVYGQCVLGLFSSQTAAHICWFVMWKIEEEAVFAGIVNKNNRLRFFRFLFKILRQFVSKSWDFWTCHHLELEVEVLGRFLWFLCLKSHCDRKLYSQRGTQMRWMRQKMPTDPTLYISYCFGCIKFFLGIWDLVKTTEIVWKTYKITFTYLTCKDVATIK